MTSLTCIPSIWGFPSVALSDTQKLVVIFTGFQVRLSSASVSPVSTFDCIQGMEAAPLAFSSRSFFGRALKPDANVNLG